jgi:hypothetical protein
VRVHTDGSAFDTVLAVYTGSSVGALTTRAADDDSGTGTASLVDLSVTGGQTYHVAVDGFDGEPGAIRLSWSFTPAPPPPSVSIAIGAPTSGGICSDNQGCYFVNATLSNFAAGSRLVRCYGRTNTGWHNYQSYWTTNGTTGGQCAYSFAGRAVLVAVDGTISGGPNNPVLDSGTWSNMIVPWPTN